MRARFVCRTPSCSVLANCLAPNDAVALESVVLISRWPVAISFFVVLSLGLASQGCDRAHIDAVRLTNKGMKALGKNNLKKARGFFEDAVSIDPENAKAHYGLGVILVEHGNPKEARYHLREATTLAPDLTEAFFQLGAIALKEKKYDEAEKALKRALEQDPDHDAAHLLSGQIYQHKGELKPAEIAYRKAVTLNPLQADGFLRLARLYHRVEAEKESVAVLREGIRLNSAGSTASPAKLSLLHNDLAITLQQDGQYGQAIDELKKAMHLPGAAPEVAFNLGWAYASKGDPELAVRYFNQYAQLVDSNNPNAIVALEVARHLSQQLPASN